MTDCRKCINFKKFDEECILNIATKEEIKVAPNSTCLSYCKENE